MTQLYLLATLDIIHWLGLSPSLLVSPNQARNAAHAIRYFHNQLMSESLKSKLFDGYPNNLTLQAWEVVIEVYREILRPTLIHALTSPDSEVQPQILDKIQNEIQNEIVKALPPPSTFPDPAFVPWTSSSHYDTLQDDAILAQTKRDIQEEKRLQQLRYQELTGLVSKQNKALEAARRTQ